MATKKKPVAHDPADRIKGETVAPTKTLKLMETIGVSRTSRMLGVSTTTLHKARKYNMVSRVIEVAAEGALRSLAGPATSAAPAMHRSTTAAFILEVDESKREMVLAFANMVGAKLLTP